MSSDAKIFSTSAARNKDIIAEAFLRLLPHAASVLEIGSGSGEHGELIVSQKPDITWSSSDPDEMSRASISARMAALGQPSAIDLDTRTQGWWHQVKGPMDAIMAVNVIHITHRSGVEGLFQGAGALLSPGGSLFLYGPFSRRGMMEESNHSFQDWLREKDPDFGVRDLDDMLQPLAARFGLALDHIERVPANNHVVTFKQVGREES